MARKRKKPNLPHEQGQIFKLTWVILKSGECVVGTQGCSFGAFTSAGGAAWTLRRYADSIERDAQHPRGNPLNNV